MKSLLALLLFGSVSVQAQMGSFTVKDNSFKSLFNTVRVAQPDIMPWAGSFFAYSQNGTAAITSPSNRSPIRAYEALANTGGKAEAYEVDKHSCAKLTGPDRASCDGWWGHCNGWTAAAIKEREPRGNVNIRGQVLTVAEQKGILSEMWLSTSSLFAGLTDKGAATGDWVHTPGTPAYQKFWDTTPRAFFTIFTNYVGLLKTGIAIDRFAGNEVWNQPVVGYRFLPIRQEDIREVKDRGVSYWSVLLRVKMYWANDLGTPAHQISDPFDIHRMTTDSESVEHFRRADGTFDYEGRLIRMRLMFDAPVRVSANGLEVLEAGQLIGDGIWDHQENSRRFSAHQLNQTHPDFIWLPQNPIQDFSGYGNPYMSPEIVSLISAANMPQMPAPPVVAAPKPPPNRVKLVLSPRQFNTSKGAAGVEAVLKDVFAREALRNDIHTKEIQFLPDRIVVPVTFPASVNIDTLNSLFRSSSISMYIEQ